MSEQAQGWHDAERAARTALATHPVTSGLASGELTPIRGSVSNFAWQATAADAERFVRLARAGNETLGANLEAEAVILQRVAAAGIAPAVVRCDPAARLLVTQWIAPQQPVRAVLQDADSLQQVAATMARLHQLDVAPDLRRVRFDEQARQLAALAPRAPLEFIATASAVFARLDAGATLALCHHDIHAQNVVFDAGNRLWLVDWEYAGLGDPVFDLASCASQCDLEPVETRHLHDAYIRAGGHVEWSRVELARWAFDYVQWLWYQGLQGSTEAGPDRAEAGRRSDRIERSLLARASGVLRCNNH